MANNPVLSQEAWAALKAASIRGVPDSQLAETFGINSNAIRQRRFLDPIWKAAIQAKRETVAESKTELSTNPVNLTENLTESEKEAGNCLPAVSAVSPAPPVTLAQKVALTVSESISSLAENNRLLALQLAAKGLRRADGQLPEISTWADVKAIYEISHKASGLDSGNSVQVNVLANGGCEFIPSNADNMGI